MKDREKTEIFIDKAEEGFKKLDVGDQYKKQALKNISKWLRDNEFQEYHAQLFYLIDKGSFNLLLDSFYQIMPFGTGGRRGQVGIGTNRLNPWTIMVSAQGHSNYLLGKFDKESENLRIVLCYDVRKYPETGIYSTELPNPIKDITSKEFALKAIQVYAANGIKCYLFDDIRSTPELSYAIRHLKAVSGIVISASHNPKEDNGKKVYSADGGQLVPPEDQELADIVNSVSDIKSIDIKEAEEKGLLEITDGKEIDTAYIKSISSLSLIGETVDKSNLSIVYSSLHGVGMTSIYQALKNNGYNVHLDDLTNTPDGSFPNVKFNVPNPEVRESMETLIKKGMAVDADILINSDPDADRLGLMSRIRGEGKDSVYKYFDGNEIGIVLTHFVLDEMKNLRKLPEGGIIAKTTVTSELITKIAKHFNIEIVSDLLVGFKYIGNVIKQLEERGEESRFILGMEESHGFLVGSYCRDKDAAGAALLLCDLAAQLKTDGKSMADYLNNIYKHLGYHNHQLTSLIFLGAEGKEKIDKISSTLREHTPEKVGQFKVVKVVDRWQGEDFLSDTDKSSRNVLTIFLEPAENVEFIKITARPSGTEPKIKIYIEVGGKALKADGERLKKEKEKINLLTDQVIDNFTKMAYESVNIEMPERGLNLSSLLPVEVKLKYFEVEEKILRLEEEIKASKISGVEARKQVDELLALFGKDPVEKISDAFQEKAGISLKSFLQERLNLNYSGREEERF